MKSYSNNMRFIFKVRKYFKNVQTENVAVQKSIFVKCICLTKCYSKWCLYCSKKQISFSIGFQISH